MRTVICLLRYIVLVNLLIIPVSLVSGQGSIKNKIKFIDNYFENASPMIWDIQGDSVIKVCLLPDYERETLNRQTDHWYFRLIADKGTHIKIIFSKLLPNISKGRLSKRWWNFENSISCHISYDQKTWVPIKTTSLPGNELMLEFNMEGESVFISRLPPYTVSDLDVLKERISSNDLVKIYNIGATVEKRPLEIIQLGNENTPNSILIRARVHPWEPGGNWVVEGIINEFLKQKSEKWLNTFCIFIMPMANKDGVSRGMTRFNINGKDLNRNWEQDPDSILCPENYALEEFIKTLVKKGKKPSLAIDFHNDDYGEIHLALQKDKDSQYIKNMTLLRELMSEHSCYSSGLKYAWLTDGQSISDSNFGFANGMLYKYGIDAVIYELNANWIKDLGKMPTSFDWMKMGENLNYVFYEYFNNLNK